MEVRQKELAKIKSYIEGIDKEVTMILQSLQWDRKHLLESFPMATCSFDAGHRVPPDKREEHERDCWLRSQGYSQEDKLFPEPFHHNADTLVKFNKEDITKIIDNASKNDPMFKKGAGCPGPAPLTLDRLQATYTADERRAIHDAAVSAAPACHDLADLALISSTDGDKTSKPKSRMEVLAELRDMRRRRAKYRVSGAANTKNYSHVLRDVIRSQMELYTATQATDTTEKTVSQTHNDFNKDQTNATKHAQHNYDENRAIFKEKEGYTCAGGSIRTRYDGFAETDQSREHKNSRGSHKPGYDKHVDRHDKYYYKDDKYYRGYDKNSKKEKEKHSQSKDRSRRDDRYERRIVIKEEFDEEVRYKDNNGHKREKYSRNHKSDYLEPSSSSSSKSKRRHTFEDYDYEDRKRRPKDDRKRKRKESSEKYSESHYKRYYDTVDIKQEKDSS